MFQRVFVCLSVLVGLAGPATAQTARDALHQLFADEWAHSLEQDPINATYAGEHRFNDLLPDVSPGAIARRLEADNGFLARLEAIDRVALTGQDRLSYDLFRFVVANRIQAAAFDTARVPLQSDSGFHTAIVRLHEAMPFRDQADYDTYLRRLEAVPDYMAGHIANLQRGADDGFTLPREILDGLEGSITALVVDEASASPFYTPFTRYPDTIDAVAQDQLALRAKAVIEGDVIPAYRRFHEFYRGIYKPAARLTVGASDVPGGRELYAYLVRYFTTLNVTADEVHQIGLGEVARIRAEMEAIIAEVGFEGSFAEFLEFLRTDPQFYAETPEELLHFAAWVAKQIDGQMPAFFRTLPRMPYSVQPVPDDLAPNYTTGRYWPAPIGGTRGGIYMVNTYGLDKRPLYNIPALTLHEGVPGHHHQIALSQELEGLPEFRRYLYLTPFGEGWGLYSEKLGVEMGIYDTPYKDFGRLTYEMWRACRLVVDTGLHAKGWSRQQAIDFLAGNTALSRHNVRTEIDRYIAWPGQALGYKMGELKILELRARAREALGEKFDIRDFHDALLINGALPLTMLEREIDGYIRRIGAGG